MHHACHSSTNNTVEVIELVTGSLVNEVQRVTLRSEEIAGSGTFRLEIGGETANSRGRDRVDADHDGWYWTSQLSANSTAEEVGTYKW